MPGPISGASAPDPIGFVSSKVWQTLQRKRIPLEEARFLTSHLVPLSVPQFQQFSLEWVPGLTQLALRSDGPEIWYRERMERWRELFMPAWAFYLQAYQTVENAFKAAYAHYRGTGTTDWFYPRPTKIIEPFLDNGSFVILYGEVGTGKSDHAFLLQDMIRQTFEERERIGDRNWPFTIGKPVVDPEPIPESEDALEMNNLGWRKARKLNLFTSVRFPPRADMASWNYTPELSAMCIGEWEGAKRAEINGSFIDEMGVNTSKFRQMQDRALTLNGLHRMRRKANTIRFVASQYRGAGDIQEEVEKGATCVIEKFDRDVASYQYRGVSIPVVYRGVPSFGDDRFLSHDSSALKVDFDITALVDYVADEMARRARNRKANEEWDPNESYDVQIAFVKKTLIRNEEVLTQYLGSLIPALRWFKGVVDPRTGQPWMQRDVADLYHCEVNMVRDSWRLTPKQEADQRRKIANVVRDIAGFPEAHEPVPETKDPAQAPTLLAQDP